MDGSTLAAIGVAINIVATLFGGVFFWGKVVQRIDEQSEARKELTQDLKELASDLKDFMSRFQHSAINFARVETRLDHAETNIGRVDRTVEDLRRGDGWMIKKSEFPH